MNRNHFGRQTESFQEPLNLPFLSDIDSPQQPPEPFRGVFIRAPVVEKILPLMESIQVEEQRREGTVIAPPRRPEKEVALEAMGEHVDVLGKLPGRTARLTTRGVDIETEEEVGDIVAVRQGNVFGTSFHPELTEDPRMHIWWLRQVKDAVEKARITERTPST